MTMPSPWPASTNSAASRPKVGHGVHEHTFGPLAQHVEQRTHNPTVAGANPAGPTNSEFAKFIGGGRGRAATAGRRAGGHGGTDDTSGDAIAGRRTWMARRLSVPSGGIQRGRVAKFFFAGRPSGPTGFIRRFAVGATPAPASSFASAAFARARTRKRRLFSERSLAARHSAWDRTHACATHAAPTILFSFRCVAQSAEHRPVKPGKRVRIPPT